MTDSQVSAKHAVELLLEQRLADDPGFLSELALDPDGAVRPLIAQVLGDDGALDLSEVAIDVHVETERRLHFVVSAGAASEVEGFAAGFLSRQLRGGTFDMGLSLPSSKGTLDTASGICICETEDCETQVACDLTKTCP